MSPNQQLRDTKANCRAGASTLKDRKDMLMHSPVCRSSQLRQVCLMHNVFRHLRYMEPSEASFAHFPLTSRNFMPLCYNKSTYYSPKEQYLEHMLIILTSIICNYDFTAALRSHNHKNGHFEFYLTV